MSRPLSDAALEHLRGLGRVPDLGGSRYRVRTPLGQGGMGTVWLAEDLDLQRPVAVKIMNEGQASPEIAARMLQEARILAQLEHPGIVPVHAVGVTPDGRIYYVMKRVRGMRIDEAVRAGRPLAWKLGLFERVCETVAFAHAAGVLHRDLKPENVMVGEFGEVLVLDWGVAKRLSEDRALREDRAPSDAEPSDLPSSDFETQAGDSVAVSSAAGPGPLDPVRTRDGVLLGTPAYMAPEQRRGQADQVGVQTDVYALGALLYFLLVGRAPQLESDTDAVVPPRRLDRQVPPPLESICLQALATSPEDRYPDTLDLAADVARFLEGGRVRAHPEGWLGRTRRVVVRYRTPILIVLAYLLVRLVLLWTSRP